MDSKTILICDDDPTVRSSLSLVLKRAGYGIATAETPEQAVAQIRTTIPGLILMDMNYTRSTTGEEGLELLAKVKVLAPEVPVILITAWGSIHLAVQGIRAGAFDFITKPWNNLALLESIRTAIQVQESSTAADAAPKSPFRRDKIIGKSPLLERVLQTVSRIASTHAPVLITGESGVGKEVFPQIIHANSSRKHGNYIAVNCGAIPEGTIDSELFGHEKGAFTGASESRKGYFEEANGGTIFLDEVAELPHTTQVRLLRVLQAGEYIRVGSSKAQKTNVRVVAATNVDLREAVRQGRFREDLYYRLNTVPISVPPLRDRKGDIYLLFRKFAADVALLYRMPAISLDEGARGMLETYPWPGNIRQLKNVAEQISAVEESRSITADILRKYLPDYAPASVPVVRGQAQGELNEERELLYKVLFDLRSDMSDLKRMVSELIAERNYERKSDITALLPRNLPAPIPAPAVHPAPVAYDEYADTEEVMDESAPHEGMTKEQMLRESIIKALRRHGGKRREAAKDLFISERTLYRKIKELGIDEY